MDKMELRRTLQNCLSAIPPEQKREKSQKACQNLISTPQFQHASVIMMYLSLLEEVDTSEAIRCAWQSDKIVAVPKISWSEGFITAVRIDSLESGFSRGASGLRNPITGVPIPVEQIDLVVAPGLGFDSEGNRLGRGGAYYDRFFANKELKALRCGFAFTEQVVDSVPTTEYDEPVDFLVTDEKVMYFKPVGEFEEKTLPTP